MSKFTNFFELTILLKKMSSNKIRPINVSHHWVEQDAWLCISDLKKDKWMTNDNVPQIDDMCTFSLIRIWCHILYGITAQVMTTIPSGPFCFMFFLTKACRLRQFKKSKTLPQISLCIIVCRRTLHFAPDKSSRPKLFWLEMQMQRQSNLGSK